MNRCARVLLGLLVSVAPLGADGRELAGRYDLKNATPDGERMSVTVLIDVQNVSAGSLAQVILELEAEAGPPMAVVGPVDLGPSTTARFAIPMSVDTTTYARWETGAAKLAGRWTDAEGNTQRRLVELSRLALPDGDGR